MTRRERHIIRERVEEALREIGVLLITLAPLDLVIVTPTQRPALLIFFCFGVFLLAGAMVLERRRTDAN